MICLFGPQGGLSILYALSLCKFTCVHLPTEAAMEPSSHPTLLTKKEVRTKLERLTMELKLMTSQRNELRDRLIFVTEGTMDNRYPLFQTPGHVLNVPLTFFLSSCCESVSLPQAKFCKKLKLEHKEIMSELKSLQNENLESSEKFSDLTKESLLSALSSWKPVVLGVLVPGGWGGRRRLAGPYYAACVSSGLHSQLLMEQTQLKKKVDMLRQENKKLMEDWVLLKHHLKDLKVICKDQEKETSDLQTQQQQVGAGPENSSWNRPQPRVRAPCRGGLYSKSHLLSPIPSNR
ncbi:LOW QUALITY PROTEIN: disks large homolog 5-like [Peromyscus leucopus]|uniref:LOW QUALITY PROTEIN: disks large homolog 5-like n=1 Tax=Peromyscus leucopus TaxID=10041 RepID=UPI001884AA3B|nr:LOW QUALITY PROTEIN: disks large homolog 5-like [Peromyscus leucopus]